ncbi:hypothetical protein HELRODRAFT_190219 [Helobdella robusta]|uniref:F5/8 type C domain-containing protein n=1 Tax=Helobdella robusta TaxID=6412 RepID=T1FRS3_HELRO|nr:hypothetical protein HELRODRAFT_190219 [Helobdella robusta]ESO10886.1 hypothetical protein HELRODRAFT_190219 [Helobdella robusta]
MKGNSNTYSVELIDIMPPVIGRRVRVHPISHSKSKRVCLTLEVYGCDWKDGLVSYSMYQGDRRRSDMHLYDRIYDGQIITQSQHDDDDDNNINNFNSNNFISKKYANSDADNKHNSPTTNSSHSLNFINYIDNNFINVNQHHVYLTNGLGALTDGVIGTTFLYIIIIMLAGRYMKIGSAGGGDVYLIIMTMKYGEPIEIIFKFDTLRKFKSLSVHCNYVPKKEVSCFSLAKIFFSSDGKNYKKTRFIEYYNNNDNNNDTDDDVRKRVKWAEVPLNDHVGSYLKLWMYHKMEWLLISEVQFISDPVKSNNTSSPTSSSRQRNQGNLSKVNSATREARKNLFDGASNDENAVRKNNNNINNNNNNINNNNVINDDYYVISGVDDTNDANEDGDDDARHPLHNSSVDRKKNHKYDRKAGNRDVPIGENNDEDNNYDDDDDIGDSNLTNDDKISDKLVVLKTVLPMTTDMTSSVADRQSDQTDSSTRLTAIVAGLMCGTVLCVVVVVIVFIVGRRRKHSTHGLLSPYQSSPLSNKLDPPASNPPTPPLITLPNELPTTPPIYSNGYSSPSPVKTSKDQTASKPFSPDKYPPNKSINTLPKRPTRQQQDELSVNDTYEDIGNFKTFTPILKASRNNNFNESPYSSSPYSRGEADHFDSSRMPLDTYFSRNDATSTIHNNFGAAMLQDRGISNYNQLNDGYFINDVANSSNPHFDQFSRYRVQENAFDNFDTNTTSKTGHFRSIPSVNARTGPNYTVPNQHRENNMPQY